MRVEKTEIAVNKFLDFSKPQGELPVSIWAAGRLGYARLATSVRSTAVKDSMLLRKAVMGALTSMAFSASAAPVVAPPLPPGSAQVIVMPGQSKEETKRMERAHRHHDKHHKKDYEHDDSDDKKDIEKPKTK